jgi:hypothetical protein
LQRHGKLLAVFRFDACDGAATFSRNIGDQKRTRYAAATENLERSNGVEDGMYSAGPKQLLIAHGSSPRCWEGVI